MKNIILNILLLFCSFSIIAQTAEYEPKYIKGQIFLENGNVISGKIRFQQGYNSDVYYKDEVNSDKIVKLSEIKEMKVSNLSFIKVNYLDTLYLLEIFVPGELMLCRYTTIISSEKNYEKYTIQNAKADYYLVKDNNVQRLNPENYIDTYKTFTSDKPEFDIELYVKPNKYEDLANKYKNLVRAYNSILE
jgi:hypothetical protein